MEVRLHLLADFVHPWPPDPELARQACRGLPLGDPSQDQNYRRGRLARLLEDGAGQDRVIAIAGFAPVSAPPSSTTTIALSHAPLARTATRALQAVGV